MNEKSSGFILFLYSLILSKTIPKLQNDLRGNTIQLLTDNEECSSPLINLLLTGNAVPFFHNGDICYDIDGNYLKIPFKGTCARSQIGYLHYDKKEDISTKTDVGSMLKTPRWPVWVGFLNGNYVLLFSVNPLLISDWRCENKFPLHYYTGLSSQQRDTELLIETRVGRNVKKSNTDGPPGTKTRDESRIPPVESLILTKWNDACVDWNGEDPYI